MELKEDPAEYPIPFAHAIPVVVDTSPEAAQRFKDSLASTGEEQAKAILENTNIKLFMKIGESSK